MHFSILANLIYDYHNPSISKLNMPKSNQNLFHDYPGYPLFFSLNFLILLGIIGLSLTMLAYHPNPSIPGIAYFWLIFWLLSSLITGLISYKAFTLGYLASLFSLMTAWRISILIDLNEIFDLITVVFLLMLANFIYFSWQNLHHKTPGLMHSLSMIEWQLIFVRMYIGFDFIPHFTEKLFCGPSIHEHLIDAFLHLGLDHANILVWLAGICEFISGISIGLGLFIRPGALFCSIYLLIATYLGHHFSIGFMWVMPGGGFEFAVLWTILVFSFFISGAHAFSFDQCIEDRFKLPRWIKFCL